MGPKWQYQSFARPLDVPIGPSPWASEPFLALPPWPVLGSFDRPIDVSVSYQSWPKPESVQLPLPPERIDEDWTAFVPSDDRQTALPWLVQPTVVWFGYEPQQEAFFSPFGESAPVMLEMPWFVHTDLAPEDPYAQQETQVCSPPDLVVIGDFQSYGVPFLHTEANWQNVLWTFEAYFRAIAGTVYARLFNETDAVAVVGSELSTTETTFQRLRTEVVLIDGKTYRAQHAKMAGSEGETLGAKLIALPMT